jgi:hypothetical protein
VLSASCQKRTHALQQFMPALGCEPIVSHYWATKTFQRELADKFDRYYLING